MRPRALGGSDNAVATDFCGSPSERHVERTTNLLAVDGTADRYGSHGSQALFEPRRRIRPADILFDIFDTEFALPDILFDLDT